LDTISRFSNTTTVEQAAVNRGEIPGESLGQMLREALDKGKQEAVNHPPHYLKHPSGVECIQITEHMNFCLGNAIKYIWRAGLKADDPVQDLSKAIWYIQREITRLGKQP
jgi:hypothetical protein